MKLKHLFFGIICFVFFNSCEHLLACFDEDEAPIENSTNIIIIEEDDDSFILKVALVCGVIVFVGYLISRYLTSDKPNSLSQLGSSVVPIHHQVSEIEQQPVLPPSQDASNNQQQPEEPPPLLAQPDHTAEAPGVVITFEPQQETISVQESNNHPLGHLRPFITRRFFSENTAARVTQQLEHARALGFNPARAQ